MRRSLAKGELRPKKKARTDLGNFLTSMTSCSVAKSFHKTISLLHQTYVEHTVCKSTQKLFEKNFRGAAAMESNSNDTMNTLKYYIFWGYPKFLG